MPCTDAGADEYYNQQEYGLYDTSANISAKVACEMRKIIYKYRLDDRLSPLARKWCENHVKQDKEQGNV